MESRRDCHHPAFARAWASIDGKANQFINGERGDDKYGHYEGYMSEAAELLNRAGQHIKAFDLFERLDPTDNIDPILGVDTGE